MCPPPPPPVAVQSMDYATRPGAMIKTKGGVGITFSLFGTSFLFICSHFTGMQGTGVINLPLHPLSPLSLPLPPPSLSSSLSPLYPLLSPPSIPSSPPSLPPPPPPPPALSPLSSLSAAHQGRVAERNTDMQRIADNITTNGLSKSHHLLHVLRVSCCQVGMTLCFGWGTSTIVWTWIGVL